MYVVVLRCSCRGEVGGDMVKRSKVVHSAAEEREREKTARKRRRQNMDCRHAEWSVQLFCRRTAMMMRAHGRVTFHFLQPSNQPNFRCFFSLLLVFSLSSPIQTDAHSTAARWRETCLWDFFLLDGEIDERIFRFVFFHFLLYIYFILDFFFFSYLSPRDCPMS